MSDADHSFYVRKSDEGIVVIIIYVDDLIIGGDMKDLGELKFFLGIEVIRTVEGIWLS